MKKPACWVISEGMQGMESQGIALANRLGLDPVIKRIRLRTPWRQLSPFPLMVGAKFALSRQGDQMKEPLPDLAICIGRGSAVASLAIRARDKERTFRVQVQDSGISPSNFNLVVVPFHDQLRGSNVFLVKGGLHNITRSSLDDVQVMTGERFASLSSPRIAVSIGGNSKAYRLSEDVIENICNQLIKLQVSKGGSMLITTSRRTGYDNEVHLRKKLEGLLGEFWDGKGENPYLAYLAWADAVLVTADSVNMITEATATGKPVYILPLEGGTAKFRRFHEIMQQDGSVRIFQGDIEEWSRPMVTDGIDDLVELIRGEMEGRGFSW